MTRPEALLKRGGAFTLVAAMALGAWGWCLGRQSKPRTGDLSAAYKSTLEAPAKERQQLESLGKRLDEVDKSLNQRLDSIDSHLAKAKRRNRTPRSK